MSGVALPMLFRVGILYFILATLAITLTRFDGGVSLLWFATAYLIAEMSAVRRSKWPSQIAAASVASLLATGLFEFGWWAALPMAGANMLEAFVAAYLLRRHARQTPLESLEWLGQFVLAATAAPLLSGALAVLVALLLGNPPGQTYVHWVAGHALSNITVTPLFILLARGELKAAWRRLHANRGEALALLALTLATIAITFFQRGAPLLFLPILAVILVAFRLGRGASVVAILALALVGGAATLMDYGPLHALSATPGEKAQFFRFYLATTVLTVWPIVADLRNRARLLAVLASNEARYRLIADHSSDILLHLELDGRIRYVSPSIGQLGGHDPQSLIGSDSSVLVAPDHLEQVRAEHRATIEAHGATRTYDYAAITASGERRWFESHSRALINQDGEVESVLSVVRDMSERKAREERLSKAAMTDSLTGLANRRAFKEAIEGNSSAPRPVIAGCIAVLDLDHFKRVNDRFGHATGDDVLRSFARIAEKMVREHDLVARIGGEEFAIFFPGTSIEPALKVCERLRLAMASSDILVGRANVRVTISGGVALLGPGGLDLAFTIADRALYEAKRNGRDRLAIAA